MGKYDWIIGIDLGERDAQIYIDDEEHGAQIPERIPIALFHETGKGTWLAGSDAIAAAFEGGDLKEGFVGSDAGLLRIYICALLDMAGVPRDAYGRVALTITAPDPGTELVTQLREIGEALFAPPEGFRVISHTQAYEYYVIAQKKEIWARDVGLFEYDHDGLRYHHLTVRTKTLAGYLAAETVDLKDVMDGSELGQADEAGLDEKFSQAIARVTGGKQISTFYLVGEGFEETEDGRIWMSRSLQKLCAYRRHVFVGQNLYAEGAGICSHYMAFPEEKPDVMLFDKESAPKEIYMVTLRRKKAAQSVLLSAGNAWYNAAGSMHVLIGSTDHLIFRIRDVVTGAEKKIRFALDDLPERPPRTTSLLLKASFVSEHECLLTAEDEGFGEFFAPSGRSWEMSFDINEPAAADPGLKEEGFVMEIGRRLPEDTFRMPVTGVRVNTMQQLCWYIQSNIDILDEHTYDAGLFAWMDRVTGDKSISDYVRMGGSCREMTRRLLSSVDYFSNNEVSMIADRLAQLEKLPANDRGKMTADNCMRNGKYLAALKQYHHLVCHMGDETPAWQAAVWHNMGLASLKLHNKAQAADCMKKARDVSGSEQDTLDYLLMLYVCGFHKQFGEEAEKAGLSEDQTQALRQQVTGAQEGFDSSEDGRRIREGIARKHEQKMADYSEFVQAFVRAGRERVAGRWEI